MKEHPFLLEPKNWLGEGKIKLSMVEEELDFFTNWDMGGRDPEGQIPATQKVEIKGMNDVMHNEFIIANITSSSFTIELENIALGTVVGKGIIKKNLIAWEFRDNELEFEGFEFYEKREDGSYLMRAEYATSDQYRTAIRGKIWEREPQQI